MATILIKLLEKISPVLCMHFARFIWSKPIKYKIPEREKSVLYESEISDLKIQSINKVIKYYHLILQKTFLLKRRL